MKKSVLMAFLFGCGGSDIPPTSNYTPISVLATRLLGAQADLNETEAVVNCDVGKVVSGGCECGTTSSNSFIADSFPVNANGWKCRCSASPPRVYVICASIE